MTYRLVCFDMEGTLIEENYWNKLSEEFMGASHKEVQAGKIRRFIVGELSYADWCDLDLGEYQRQGRKKEEFDRVAKKHRLVPGTHEALAELKKAGIKLAVISGALNVVFDILFPEHPFDEVFCTGATFDKEGKLESWDSTPYETGTKHHGLRRICEQEGIPLSETVFVGDGPNDIEALEEAGLGITICPKDDTVKEAADIVIEKRDLREILPYILKN